MDPEQKNQLKWTLLNSAEGRLLLVGVALAFIYILWLGITLLLSPDQFHAFLGTTTTELVFGRAAGMAIGYSLGLRNREVIPICAVIETVSVLVFYPLFVLAWEHLLVISSLKNYFDRAHQAALTHQAKIQRYGIVGLFVFVWFPFWMTGPMVGSVIGFLLGLPVWLNMTIVLGATYTAIIAWALFWRHVHERAASYSAYAPVLLVLLVIAVVIAGRFLPRLLRKIKDRL